ncbi:MAG: DUF975 family protein [Clostridiales bacterium]|nr:DUF975 family protein [Clostridiales bacterium]
MRLVSHSELKANGRRSLANGFFMALIACLIVAAVSYGFNYAVNTIFLKEYTDEISEITQDFLEDYDGDMDDLNEYIHDVNKITSRDDYRRASGISSLIDGVFNILVVSVLSVGMLRFFLLLRYNRKNPGTVFGHFTGGHYFNTVKTNFFQGLYIFLWALLLVIPGIVKAYSYFMVSYIIAENPEISTKRAFEISKDTMYGSRADLFTLQLSFIGWFLLSCLTFGLGFIWLVPYFRATMAEYYVYMKAKAFERRITDISELPDVEFSGAGTGYED